MNRQAWRKWLARLLVSSGVCALIAMISAVLQGALAATGDADGATAVRGVLLVAVTGLGMTLVAQFVILVVLELNRES